ncbi:MAG: 2-amino-4-hydroxy-6-hydroxymethyldihydropteridine diphosphokinase [Chloroflexi bacterium]|nr:2-amino-4-hydroxy-6-hydroxymethyldihydropteridine diphosphokinase [Chloroflexota bacterium]
MASDLVFISLGSNINPERNIGRALAALEQHTAVRVRAISPVYESLPVGASVGQAHFLNAAVCVETTLTPSALRLILLDIERDMGRVRTDDKYAARPIDLDICVVGEQILDFDGKRIPDPEILLYPHLALPLADIAPNWNQPELHMSLREIADSLDDCDDEIMRVQDAA